MNAKNRINLWAIGLLLFSACAKSNSHDNKGDDTNPPFVTGDPVETQPANTDYKPAFPGQTRIGSVKTTTPFQANVITSALNRPWGIISLPDGRLLITEKVGQMRIVSETGALEEIITGLPAVNAAGQGGLLGLCIDPDFITNRMVYWVFSENVSGGSITSVAKGRLANDEKTMENVAVIYRSNTVHNGSLHFGGRVLFDRTGNLLVSIGERSDLATRPLAQSPTSSLGKIIRITKDGKPAPNNPVFAQSGALPELFTIGHRNPQGLAAHPVTGDIWQSEHGPRGGDEINRLQGGANYGWPIITYGIEYGGRAIGDAIQQKEGMEQPVYYWDPVVSPSGMTFYKGNNIPEWENNLFIGSLSATHIVRLVISNNRVVGEERLLESENQRFRDITQSIDGALYAITDGGRLYKIERK